jgi:myo-inositol-1(or 4)-monophosphatase
VPHEMTLAEASVFLDLRSGLCERIVRSAGAIALAGFNKRDATFQLKGPQDFLTETDGTVENHLRAEVAKAFPEDAFLGEEAGGEPGEHVWVVDPIDGTANFARGIPHYCISIAFVSGNQIELGAIYNPSLNDLYFARRGQGATLNGKPIRVATTSRFDAACVEFGWSPRRTNETYLAAFSAILERGANVRRAASGALGLAFVADGRSDAYAELHMNSWDCLAGLLLVKEAGGKVGPFFRDGGLVQGGAVIAAAPGIAEAMSEAVGLPLDP